MCLTPHVRFPCNLCHTIALFPMLCSLSYSSATSEVNLLNHTCPSLLSITLILLQIPSFSTLAHFLLRNRGGSNIYTGFVCSALPISNDPLKPSVKEIDSLYYWSLAEQEVKCRLLHILHSHPQWTSAAATCTHPSPGNHFYYAPCLGQLSALLKYPFLPIDTAHTHCTPHMHAHMHPSPPSTPPHSCHFYPHPRTILHPANCPPAQSIPSSLSSNSGK